MQNSLDTNLLAVIAGQKSAQQAMDDTAKDWDSISQRNGVDKLMEEIKYMAAEFPTVTETPKIQAGTPTA